MPLRNSVVQRRLARRVGRVDGAAVLDQERQHGHRAHRSRPVQRVLPALVTHARRGRGRVRLEQLAREVEVAFGGEEM